MSVSYDVFTGAFLQKVSEFEFIKLQEENRVELIDGDIKRALASFKKISTYDFISSADDETREFNIEIEEGDLDEIADIVSEGMVVQWLKPYVYKQEILELHLNTKDYSTYSPAELLKQVGGAYARAQKDFTQMLREYSYNHGDLTVLHL